MPFGRKYGLILLAGAVIIAIINYVLMTQAHRFYYVITLAVPVLLLMGLMLVIFPGGTVPKGQQSMRTSEVWKVLWRHAPKPHQIAWLVGLALVLVVLIWGVFDMRSEGPVYRYILRLAHIY